MAEESTPSGAPEAREPSGFHYRELLLVIGGCLLLLAAAAGLKWHSARGNVVECRARLEALWTAARQEAQAHQGRLPRGPRAIETLVFEHLRHDRYRRCPQTESDYRWTSRERKLGDDPRRLLAWEVKPHGWPVARHRALFIDGRVEDLGGDELKELLAREKREPPPPRSQVPPRPELREDAAAPPPGWRMPPQSSDAPDAPDVPDVPDAPKEAPGAGAGGGSP